MSRLFEIHDSKGSRHCSDSDLPLTIGTTQEANVILESGQEIEGYIDDSNGHIFFQPAGSVSQIFHNNELISTSTWIKSEDTTRIGQSFLQYYISGDLVEIRVSTETQHTVITPPDSPPPDLATDRGKLPRKTPEDDQKHGSGTVLRRLIGSALVVLLLVAGFVLAAKSLEITINPEPDSLSISGFPPVIQLGDSFLGLKGEYILQTEKEGYQPVEAPIIISNKTANRYSFTLEKLPGLVTFRTTPEEGAEVFIDDSKVGVTSLVNFEISPGEHHVRITIDRYLPFEETISVEGMRQKQQYAFSLLPAWSEVTFTTEPAGAVVFIQDERQGETPLTLELMEGQYTIAFKKDTYSNSRIQLNVPAGESLNPETVVLTPAPATLELITSPEGSTVTLDSVFKGQTPLTLSIDANVEHTLTVGKQGFESLEEKVLLTPGETKQLSLKLKPEYGVIFLAVDPPDAELYIDGKHRGKATGRMELEVRQHTFELRAKGYSTVTRTVTPSKELSRQVKIRLEPIAAQGGPGKTPIEKTVKNSKGMILLQPAAFEMGASRREPGRRANERLRKVQISRPYFLAEREVTNEDFRRFKPDHSSGSIGGQSLDNDKQSVVNVSWDDAARYLNWLSKQDGLEPFYREENGTMVPVNPMTTGYRLPFESEWAYAARYSGRKTAIRYPWPGPFPPAAKSGNFADESSRTIQPVVIRGYNDSFPVTSPAANFPRNLGGFFDIGGNVSEWCHDLYNPYTGFSQKEMIDPMGPATGTHHVVRGSSWRDGSITELRLSYRSYSNRGRDDLGFRAARFAK